MATRLEELLSQARMARGRANAAEGELRTQWLRVAEQWELLAKEYRSLNKFGENGAN